MQMLETMVNSVFSPQTKLEGIITKDVEHLAAAEQL